MRTAELKHFNIRVYGLIINEKQQVLLSDEYVLDQAMTKFPGGGLQFGEGPADCIKREALEEFGQEVEIIEHFYTTHFFQQALFYPDHQLISIYYRIRFTGPLRFSISDKPFDFPAMINGSQSFRWAYVSSLEEEVLSFPVDRYVLGLLKKRLF
ncbi:MAG: NUDIX domain-containing protein [Bacteroidales bacterium]|nr:NUDIX domain-containing protein [Bacteroidales bacterium]MBN2764050.1 NUDIX domain-containing protein [Bacteroidales bacterium]